MPKISQNMNRISKEIFLLVFFVFFLNYSGKKSYLKKSRQYALPNLGYISSNTIS